MQTQIVRTCAVVLTALTLGLVLASSSAFAQGGTSTATLSGIIADDTGGRLSFSAALLDDAGDGLVISAIHGRTETRSYAKGVKAGRSDQQLSPEESQAIGFAMRADPGPAGRQPTAVQPDLVVNEPIELLDDDAILVVRPPRSIERPDT